MTLNYNREVTTTKHFTIFKLLFRWKASIWKAVYFELFLWLLCYAIVSIIYRCVLDKAQKTVFERAAAYFARSLKYFPLELVLGFYTTKIFDRWDYQYRRIGFIDKTGICILSVGLMVAEYVRGHNERGRRFRRAILRYCELGQILSFRDISLRVRRRFPTFDTVVAAGFMLPSEKLELEKLSSAGNSGIHQVPFQWALSLAYKARREGFIEGDRFQQVVSDQIKDFRSDIQECVNYDWTPLPLLYNNVVCLAVHMYFLTAIMGRQLIISGDAKNKTPIDLYFPVMAMIQYVLYLGWLKVGSAIINPFGEDDDDWETNALIDRNITMGLMIVDQGFDRPPELRKDPFWDLTDLSLLYSEESAKQWADGALQGSVSHIQVLNTAIVRMIGGEGNSQRHIDVPVDNRSDLKQLPRSPSVLSFADIVKQALERLSPSRQESEPATELAGAQLNPEESAAQDTAMHSERRLSQKGLVAKRGFLVGRAATVDSEIDVAGISNNLAHHQHGETAGKRSRTNPFRFRKAHSQT